VLDLVEQACYKLLYIQVLDVDDALSHQGGHISWPIHSQETKRKHLSDIFHSVNA
jgi:hypothetical protein